MARIALVLVAAVTTASLTEAQTVESFDRLALLVNQGDRLTVTDRAGEELQGRLVDLTPTTLSLQIDDGLHDLAEANVSLVRRRQRDSLKNGALLGFMAGAAIAASLTSATHPFIRMSAMSLFGAAGIGIGVGFDAFVQDSRVVYRATRSARRLTVSPLLTRDRRGVSLSLGF